MGIEFALEQLLTTGWQTLDTTGCECTPDGRFYPGVDRVKREFAAAGFELSIRKVDLFDCHRAEWRDASGNAIGGVVGREPEEAAVYALAQMRRATQLVATH